MDELLRQMENYAAKHRVPIIVPEAAALVSSVVIADMPLSILEVGTAIGYSTLIIARHMPPTARIVTVEIDEQRAATARAFFMAAGFADRIDVQIGDAAQIVTGLCRLFDMVFLDAAKAQYLVYLRAVLGQLPPGAVVVADNVLFRGLVQNGGVPPKRLRTIVSRMRDYLSFVTTDPRFVTTVHEVGDGVAISRYQGEIDI